MSRRMRPLLLSLVISMCAVFLAIALLNRELLQNAKAPAGLDGAAAWLTEHPADWVAAAAITDAALDANTPQRGELWRKAHAHTKHLAPYRRNADAAFVRAGLFHWYELSSPDRALVKNTAGPLLREPEFFMPMRDALWQLTRDFPWLHANAPDTMDARNALRDLAVTRGLFREYRDLREDVRAQRMKQFTQSRESADPATLPELVPDRPTVADEPLLRGILEELDRKPFDPEQINGRVETLVDYAVRHDLQPLTGVLPLIETQSKLRAVTRARAALALNNATAATRIEVENAVSGAAEWEPYLLDRARFEARRGDAAAADGYLVRAAAREMNVRVLATAEKIATMLHNTSAAAEYHKQLVARAKEPRSWSGACGNELCTSATRDEYVAGEFVRVELTTTQSDETPPYVEIYVDDALRAEGEVRDSRTFEWNSAPGLHTIELRLINSRTRNGAQRRVAIK